MMKIMRNLKVEYYQEALITHNLNVTWDNIENDLRRANGRHKVDKAQDWYQKETFQRLLRNLYGTDKQKLLLFLDDVLLQIPETNLVKAVGDELRTRLNALSLNNQAIDERAIFKRQWRGFEQSRESPQTTTSIYIFRDIQNATIINASLVENSFNKVKRELDEETGNTLVEIAKFIEKSGNASAGLLFDKFNEELNKPQPEKSRLSDFWSGIVAVLPSVATLAGAVSKITGLLG